MIGSSGTLHRFGHLGEGSVSVSGGVLMKSRNARLCALGAAVVLAAASIGVLAPAGSGQTNTRDAITAARFVLTTDGYELASFSELQGITTEVTPAEYISSADKGTVQKKLPGKAKPATLVLKRGKNSGMELFAWHEAARRGQPSARKSCTLTMYNDAGEPVAKYYLSNAWPFKLEITALKAGSSEVLYETVHLTADSVQRLAAK
jgi:phage tail-like protein